MNYITKDKGIRLINKLLHEQVRDFNSYNKIIKEKLNIKVNIPIYIDKTLILLPIKRYNSYDCIWINYLMINSLMELETKTIIKFKNGEIKAFNIKKKKLDRIINNANVIISYFEKMNA